MEIKNPNYAFLTNFEVMEVLQNIKNTNNKKNQGLRNLATITYETLQYLENRPCKDQAMESIQQFLNETEHLSLTVNESLMIINDPPTLPLHVQILVEDSEVRLSEEQVLYLLDVVKRTLIPELEPEPFE